MTRSDAIWVVLLRNNKVVEVAPYPVRDNKVLIRPRGDDKWTPVFGPNSVMPLYIEIPRRFRRPKRIWSSCVIVQEGSTECFEIKGEKIVDPETGLVHPLSASDIAAFVNYVIAQSIEKEEGRNWWLILILILQIITLLAILLSGVKIVVR